MHLSVLELRFCSVACRPTILRTVAQLELGFFSVEFYFDQRKKAGPHASLEDHTYKASGCLVGGVLEAKAP